MRQPATNIEEFDKGNSRLPLALEQMGYPSLRKGQDAPITNIMLQRDTICILPTGAGKTALHAIPTIAMEWCTIVFSPLVGLMRDQVQSMQRVGLRAACVNSAQTDAANYMALQDWANGDLQMLFVAPERINNEVFQRTIEERTPDLVVVDEAHVMSQWSDSFRPSYKLCGDFVRKFNPRAVAALTATATTQVVRDIVEILTIQNATICRYYPARKNLQLRSLSLGSTEELKNKLLDCVREVSGSIIVYCQTVKDVTDYMQYLSQCGESVTFYHGQITDSTQRARNQDEFMSGRARICVATNAFGMGIDKPDIEAVIHTGPPGSIEAVSQEVGRAARDGRNAYCTMLVTPYGLNMQRYFLEIGNPTDVEVQKVYDALVEMADHAGIVNITGKDLSNKTGVKSSDAVLGFLQSRNCVERIASEDTVYQISIYHVAREKASALEAELLSAIERGGVVLAEQEEFNTYGVDINWLVADVSRAKATVDTRLRTMQKNNIIFYTLPFRGKSTKILRPISSEDLAYAKERYYEEAQKLIDVQRYLDTPDMLKHTYLQQYFKIEQDSVE